MASLPRLYMEGYPQQTPKRQTIKHLILDLFERQAVVVAQENHFEHE